MLNITEEKTLLRNFQQLKFSQFGGLKVSHIKPDQEIILEFKEAFLTVSQHSAKNKRSNLL